jgi:hypothetical protein
MLSYRKAMPLVKEICRKYKVPYVQENVLVRLSKTVNIMVGHSSMRTFPNQFLHGVAVDCSSSSSKRNSGSSTKKLD